MLAVSKEFISFPYQLRLGTDLAEDRLSDEEIFSLLKIVLLSIHPASSTEYNLQID